MTSSQLLRAIATTTASVLLANLGFLLLMMGGALIPGTRERVLEAARAGVITPEDYPPGFDPGHAIDAFSECCSLGMAADVREEGVIRTALAPRYSRSSKSSMCGTIIDDMMGDTAQIERVEYRRYWHGYALFTKLAMIGLPYAALRLVNASLFVLALLLATMLCAKVTNTSAALALFAPLLFFSDWHSVLGLITHLLPMTLCLFSFAVILARTKPLTLPLVMIMSALHASVFAFVDTMNAAPLSMCLIPLGFMLLAWRTGAQGVQLLKVLVFACTGWFIGYTMTFVSKQVLTATLLGDASVYREFLDALLLRLGVTPDPQAKPQLFAALRVVASQLGQFSIFNGSTTRVLFAIGVMIFALRAGQLALARRKGELNQMIALGLPAVLPLIWYEVFSNHTQIHARLFMGRYACLTPAVLLFAVAVTFPGMKQPALFEKTSTVGN